MNVRRVIKIWANNPKQKVLVDQLTAEVFSRMGCETFEQEDHLYYVELPHSELM